MNFTKQNSSLKTSDCRPEPNAKALLIEEDRKLDKLFNTVANNSDYLLEIAENGQIALQMITEKYYDIILLDIDFSDKNGLDLIPEIQKIVPEIKIISITAHNPKEIEMQARNHKVIYHLIKPFAIAELSSTLIHIARNL